MQDFFYQSCMWNEVIIYHVTQYQAPGRCWQNLTGNQITVAVILEQIDGYFEPRRHINHPTPRSRYDAGHTTFLPPNIDIWGYSDSIRSVRYLRMHFDWCVLERFLGEEPEPKSWHEPLLLLYDDRITQCAHLLAKECTNEDETDTPLYGESLTTALLAALFASPRMRTKQNRCGLARWQLRRAVEYMEANLLNNIRLYELAKVAELSPSQFGRAFKVSTGLTPYRYLIEKRIQQAKRLMQKDRMSISLAAHLSGFANQSHFTKAFRSVTGTSPALWLRDAVEKR
jgi:AraC family transcriptional regulator